MSGFQNFQIFLEHMACNICFETFKFLTQFQALREASALANICFKTNRLLTQFQRLQNLLHCQNYFFDPIPCNNYFETIQILAQLRDLIFFIGRYHEPDS